MATKNGDDDEENDLITSTGSSTANSPVPASTSVNRDGINLRAINNETGEEDAIDTVEVTRNNQTNEIKPIKKLKKKTKTKVKTEEAEEEEEGKIGNINSIILKMNLNDFR